MESCVFERTNGTMPMAGVDLEPDRPHQQLSNVTFTDCSFIGNAGAGFQIIANAFSNETAPISVLLDGGYSRNNQYGLTAESFHPGLRGSVVYSGVEVDGAAGVGLEVCNKAPTSALLTIRNVTLKGTALPPAHWPEPWLTIPPVALGACGNRYRPANTIDAAFGGFGGLVLSNLSVTDAVARQWLSVSNYSVAIDWESILSEGGRLRRGPSVIDPLHSRLHGESPSGK